ncbi:MAG: gamma-glutamyltransferase family protein [Armatimonadota bacterium]
MTEGREVVSPLGAIAAQPQEAARLGARIMQQGGNAFDAAAASALASCLLQPQSTGITGYVLCAVVRDGKTGEIWSLDANSVAPAAAREDMYEILPASGDPQDLNSREYGCSVRDSANVFGPLAVGVPGMAAGIGTLWERWGRLKWPEIVAPAQALLAEGIPFGGTAGAVRSLEEVIRRYPATARQLLVDGRLPEAEDIMRRPGLDATLARIAEAGWRDLYRGELAREIAAAVQEAGGILTFEDLAAYEPRVTPTLRTTYRDATVHGPILPNGTMTCLQILNMLECFDPSDDADAMYWHRLAEVLKLAWRDRLHYLTDPDFADVPVERLLSKDYAAGLVERTRQFPRWVDDLPSRFPPGAMHGTLHLSTADAEGNLVSATITQGMAFGACFVAGDTGLILSHGMCRFDPRPGRMNSVAPGKRPLNNAGTMLVETPERFIATGLPGGRRIVSVMARAAQRFVDANASPLEAAEAPRMHVEVAEPVQVTESLGEGIVGALREMGHQVEVVGGVAGAMHSAELNLHTGSLRAGGNHWAAGVD